RRRRGGDGMKVVLAGLPDVNDRWSRAQLRILGHRLGERASGNRAVRVALRFLAGVRGREVELGSVTWDVDRDVLDEPPAWLRNAPSAWLRPGGWPEADYPKPTLYQLDRERRRRRAYGDSAA